MKNLEKHINSLKSHVEHHLHSNAAITKSTVGWQIDHSLRVVNGVVSVLQKSSIADFNRNFNWKRTVVFFTKSIPRGKAKAPQAVQASADITLPELQILFEETIKSIEILRNLDRNANFKHPFFGVLNLKQSIIFLEIHTNHHLKIVQDCLKS